MVLPLKLTLLPKISESIQNAKTYFKHDDQNPTTRVTIYCYCTKSSTFQLRIG